MVPYVPGGRRSAVGGPQDVATGGDVLRPVGQHKAEVRREVADHEEEQFAGGVVDPAEVLDQQHRGAEHLEEGAYALDAPVPVGVIAFQGRRLGGQPLGEVRQERRESADRGRDLGGRRKPGAGLAQGVHHRAERDRFAQRVAQPDQDGQSLGGELVDSLVDQTSLADARLAFDEEYRRMVPESVEHLTEFLTPADDRGHLTAIAPELLERARAFSAPQAQHGTIERYDVSWHAFLLSGCRNTRLNDLIDSLKLSLHRYERAVVSDQEILARSAEEHERIAQALLDGDLDRAATALEANWTSGMHRILERLPA